MKHSMNNKTLEPSLFAEISAMIEQARGAVVAQANHALTLLFWNIGKRVKETVLQNRRADYGKQIVVTLARQLTEKYGRNFEERNLRRMMRFSEQFQNIEIVSTLSPLLNWPQRTN